MPLHARRRAIAARPAWNALQAAQKIPALTEPGLADTLGKRRIGKLEADARLVIQAERVVRAAQSPTPLAHGAFQSLVQGLAENDVRRKRSRLAPMQASHDRARAGTGRAR